MSDQNALLLFSAVLLGAVALGEALRAWFGVAPETSRRVVHASVGIATALCPPLFSSPALIYVLAIAFVGVNLVAVPRRLLPGMHGIERKSWGTVTFPLALIAALYLCWTLDPSRVYVLQVAFVVLALADPAASLVGTALRRPGAYAVAGETKSVAGSVAFAVVAGISTAVVLLWLRPAGVGATEIASAIVGVAFFATIGEALGRKGWDNLLIVLATIVAVVSAIEGRTGIWLNLGAIAISVIFGVVAYRLRSLDLSGAMAATGLAWMVVALGGFDWVLPAFTFFVLSSLLSALGRRRKQPAEALSQKGSRRDSGQVMANGGVAALALGAHVLSPDVALYWAFVGSFAAAAADTWGTEVGTLVGGRTRLLAIGREVAPGTSGGMSLFGTVGAALGALAVAATAVLTAADVLQPPNAILVLVASGLAAALLDSLLGASVQARYLLPGGGLTERTTVAGVALPLAAGLAWVDNDAVNLACTMLGGAIPLIAFA